MSFDWTTLALQLVNVLILLAILRHFLFRPVAAIIARRQADTDQAMQATASARAEAEAAAQRAEAEARANVAARLGVLDKAQSDAAVAAKALTDAARAEAAQILSAGRSARDAEAAADQDRLLARARDLAGTIAARALAEQPADLAGYAARLAAALTALPAMERQALLTGGGLRIVTAAPLTKAEHLAVTQALAGQFSDAEVAPEFRADPALIRGLDLVSDAGALRNSLAHDLDRIAQALRDDHD